MSLQLAQRHAFYLSKTLMVCIVLVLTDEGYGAMPSFEFDGPSDRIIHEYDPFD
jgi:hypothetical protein